MKKLTKSQIGLAIISFAHPWSTPSKYNSNPCSYYPSPNWLHVAFGQNPPPFFCSPTTMFFSPKNFRWLTIGFPNWQKEKSKIDMAFWFRDR